MRMIVCIKQVPKGSSVKMDPEKGTLIRISGETEMNPHDRYAIEMALRIRENMSGTVIAVSMGTMAAKSTLMEALELGVDEAYLLTGNEFAGADVLATAYSLSQVIRMLGAFDLILCGRQTTDGDTGQTGPELAEFLEIPHLTQVSEVGEISTDFLRVFCMADQVQHTAAVKLPCLLTVEKGIYPLRMPTLKGKMAAKKKLLQLVSLDMLADTDRTHYGLKGSPTRVKRIFSPEQRAGEEIRILEAAEAAVVICSLMLD